MVNLFDVSVVDTFKGFVLDSLMKDGFIRKPQQNQGNQENFFIKNKKLLLTGAAVIAVTAFGPVLVGGVVAALGCGEAGIAAGSIAARMMSLHRGAVAAGSLVAILQPIGAAGLGIGAIIAAGGVGGIFAGTIAKALLKSNPEGLAELENFVSITSENENASERAKVIFNMKQQLLANNENEKLKSFLKGFDLAQQVFKDRVKQFEFLVIRNDENCLEGSEFLHKHLIDTYGNDHVHEISGGYFLSNTCRFIFIF